MDITWSGGLVKEGGTETLPIKLETGSISLRMPLISRWSKVLAPKGDPFAHIERSRIKPCMTDKSEFDPNKDKQSIWKCTSSTTVYVDVLRDAWTPPELLVEISAVTCSISPWLHSSSNLSGDEAIASTMRVKQTEECSNTWKYNTQPIYENKYKKAMEGITKGTVQYLGSRPLKLNSESAKLAAQYAIGIMLIKCLFSSNSNKIASPILGFHFPGKQLDASVKFGWFI